MNEAESHNRLSRWIRLAAVCVLFAVIWGAGLPAVGRWAAVRSWIEPLKAEGINPDAVFYTDVFNDNRHSKR